MGPTYRRSFVPRQPGTSAVRRSILAQSARYFQLLLAKPAVSPIEHIVRSPRSVIPHKVLSLGRLHYFFVHIYLSTYKLKTEVIDINLVFRFGQTSARIGIASFTRAAIRNRK